MEDTKYTLDYYKDNTDAFYNETVIAETDGIRNRFLDKLAKGASILDFGCGSGRDTKAFLDLGFAANAIDGSPELAAKASELTGIDVRCVNFFDFDEVEKYDGIWACASVLHVEKERLPEVLTRMRNALKPGGVMYLSFKYGDFAGHRDDRYFVDLNEETFAEIIAKVDGVEVIDEWQSMDVRRGKDVHWLNEIVRKK